ncbi:MAG: hypothetical protein C3F13_04745 [Anaerolineales bacterium]|nr:MAG: hypothetical protein C3F13_04745 [Anaerolineales bacterium]
MMVTSQVFDSISPWILFLFIIFFLLLAFDIGRRAGIIVERRWPDEAEANVAAKVGAALTILAFLLAFVVNLTLNTFNEKRQLVISEANAIGTAYLRAGYLPEPYKSESRQLLHEYIDFRLKVVDPTKSQVAIAQSEQIQDKLWVIVEQVATETPTPTASLYISSINDLIDIHTQRLTSEIGFRLPLSFTLGLLGVSMLVMVLIGISDSYRERNNRLALVVIVVLVALVFLLIIGMDRSNIGLVRVPLTPLIDLQQKLGTLP